MTNPGKRRSLHFETLEDALDDVVRLRDHGFVAIGNWSAGKIVQHLADTITYSIDGFPPSAVEGLEPVHPRLAERMITKSVRAGIELPAQFEAILPDEETDLDAAVESLREATDRAAREKMTSRSPLLGPMNHERWVQGHCRHAELHLSFLIPVE